MCGHPGLRGSGAREPKGPGSFDLVVRKQVPWRVMGDKGCGSNAGAVVAVRGVGNLGGWRGWKEGMRVAGSGESGGWANDGRGGVRGG